MAEANVDAGKAKKINVTAYGLILVAPALPLLAAGLGMISAGRAGYVDGQLFIPLLLGVIVAIPGLGGKSVAAKARLRLGVGIGIVALATITTLWACREDYAVQAHERQVIQQAASDLLAVVDPSSKSAATQSASSQAGSSKGTASSPSSLSGEATSREAAFARGTLDMQKRLAAQFTLLGKQFAAIDLSSALTPSGLTDGGAIQTSRASLQRLTSLINERDLALDQYAKEAAQYFRTADIDEVNRRAAIESFERGMPKTVAAFHDLSAAQLASVAAFSDVLDFAESNLGAMVVHNGQLLFGDPASLDQYRRLLDRVRAAAEQEAAVTKSTTELQAKSLQWIKQQSKGN